ncbi:clathrin light chain [Trichuris suis]|nr:clathrin light chain [Trichuris suis]
MSEEDAVADFLAREKATLAGIDDFSFEDLGSTEENVNSIDKANPLANGELNDTPVPPISGEQPAAQPTYEKVIDEPETIKAWRQEQETRLRNKDLKEETEKQRMHDQAKLELEEWYRSRADQVEKNKKNNRIMEQEFIEQRDSTEQGKEWEKIAGLCDFNPKTGRNTKDVSRMRTLFLQMKSQPTNETSETNGQ